MKRVVCAEIVPGLLKSARFFTPAGRDFLKDPRFSLVENDGRNFLLLSREKFDVIVSEPSNPWIAGIGTLFTGEFFKPAGSRLNPGGIMCQWVQIYQMTEEDLKDVLHTFGRSFPYMMVWMGSRSDPVLIGSRSPLTIDFPEVTGS